MATPWLYGPISREEAESKLLYSSIVRAHWVISELFKDNNAVDGQWLIRQRPENLTEYVVEKMVACNSNS